MPSESTSKRTQDRGEDQAVIRRLFEQVYSKGKLGAVDDLVAPDFTGYSTELPATYGGAKGVKTHVSQLRTAFHGFTLEIDDLHLEGDTFEVAWTARGTHERPFRGIDPTCNIGQAGEEPHGNRIAVSGVSTGTIRNGTIHESRMVWDVETLRHQLGTSDGDLDTETRSRESNPQKLHEVSTHVL